MNPRIQRARRLRQKQTEAECLLWSVLRAGRLCELKFRRQHPVEPYFADFACVEHMLIVELDGEYHEQVGEQDLSRQRYLQSLGWRVLRFTNEDVAGDVEAVCVAIARTVGLKYAFSRKIGDKSGMYCPQANKIDRHNGGSPSRP